MAQSHRDTAVAASVGKPDDWGLLGRQFGLREKAAATTIGKICGSIVTRPQYTSLFDMAQSVFHLTTEELPVWLRDLQFVRSVTVLGENMRRIKLDRTMEDVDKFKLSGLSTFVVLCSKYGEDTPNITRMINLLLIGALGNVIRPPDPEQRPDLPYTFKPHVNAFISSCLDADRASDISQRTTSWMAELHLFGELTRVDENDSLERRRQASLDLMGELLGAPSPEETMSKHVRALYRVPKNHEGWARVHNTLHLMSAYMALAAAAQGASVVVECITRQGSKFIPGFPTPVMRKTTFLVRLWLVQPPEDVLGIMRYSTSNTTDAWQDRQEDRFGIDPENSAPTIFGGKLELAVGFARALGFRTQDSTAEEHEELLALWTRGAECASHYRWTTLRPASDQSPLRFTLDRPENMPVPLVASQLCEHFKSDRRLRPISRTVATLVHDYYRYSDYSSFSGEEGESQMAKAMHFVLLAMAVQVLRNTVSPVSDSTESYALNTGSLDSQKMGLRNLMAMAVSEEGVSPFILVHTAATVWGGLTPASYHTPRPGEAPVGVVAPHCCVLLDAVRDPLEFARKGVTGHLLSIWRGAVPMLPRDPNTNLVCGYADATSKPFELTSSYEPIEEMYKRPFGSMLITFEPHVSQPTCGVFCAWFSGHLVMEIHPDHIVSGLLRRRTDSLSTTSNPYNPYPAGSIIKLSKADLLYVKQFAVAGGHAVVIEGIDDAAWLVFAAGCNGRIPDLIVWEHKDKLPGPGDMKGVLRSREVVILKAMRMDRT